MELSPTRQKTMKEDARQTTALGGIKEEELPQWIQKFTDANGKLLEPEKVHGYYQEKKKYKVKTVNDFIQKLRRTELCLGFFAQNNIQYAGMQKLFQKFYELTRKKLKEDEILGTEEELDHNMVEINNYVMFNLHSEFFFKQEQSQEEIRF